MVSVENRTGLYVAIPIYFVLLASVAYWGWRRTNTLKDSNDALSAHYLGGRSFGPLMTAGTMFASLFSGYTVVGVPNEAFRTGWASLRWFPSAIGVVAGYAGTGYRLRRCSLIRNHQSPVDFITDRFRSQFLRYTIVMLQAIPSIIYLSAQVISIKGTFNSLFELDPDSPVGVIIIFVLIILFEWTGGLVSVASTDAIQGIVMSLAFLALPVVVHRNFGGWSDLDPATYPEPTFYQNPTAKTQWLLWNFGLVNVGFFSLPHLLQRTYAARDLKSLKWGYSALAVGAWFTWMPGIFLGTMGVKILADAGVENPSSPFAAILEQIMSLGGFSEAVGVIAFTASLAAIMSTADSIIIAISQLLCSEFAYPMKPDATPAQITWIGRGISLLTTVVALLIGLFWDKGLSDLAKVQFGLSLQCIPAFFVGLFASGPTDCHPWSLAAGGIVGCIMTFSLYFGYIKDNADAVPMDAGVTSTFFNCVLVFIIEVVRRLVTGTLFNKSDATLEETAKIAGSFTNASVVLDHQVKAEVEETEETVAFMNRPQWDKPKTVRFGEKPLTPNFVWKTMEGTWEPLTNPALVFLLFLIITVTVPFIPEGIPALSEDGTFLFPPATVAGIPHWAFKMLMVSVVGTVTVLIMVYHMPTEFSLSRLDPDIAELLPGEMNKRKTYDEKNLAVATRRESIRDSIELIKEREHKVVDYTHRRRVSQLMMGEVIQEDQDEEEPLKGGEGDENVEVIAEQPVAAE